MSSFRRTVWRRKEAYRDYSGYFSKRLEKRYEAPAWAVLLDPTAPLEVNQQAILSIVRGKYVDLQTTAVFVDLTVYNPDLDYSCVIKLVAELPPGGGVYTSSEFHVVRVYNRYIAEDKRSFVLNVLCGLFCAYYFVAEMVELYHQGLYDRYLHEAGNVMIIANVCIYTASIIYRAKMHALAPANMNIDSGNFHNYWPCGQCARWAIRLSSANCFINFFQGVEHLSYVPTFALLSDTIRTAGPDLLSFMFVFVLVGHCMAFRDRIAGYRTAKHSCYSILSALLGDFDFNKLYEADNILVPFYFIFFIGLAVFVVLNMVIAIISDAHSMCSEEMRSKPKVNLMQELYKHIFEDIEALPCGVGGHIRQNRLEAEKKLSRTKERAKLKAKSMRFNAPKKSMRFNIPKKSKGSVAAIVPVQVTPAGASRAGVEESWTDGAYVAWKKWCRSCHQQMSCRSDWPAHPMMQGVMSRRRMCWRLF
jgi:hypothetical protein